jgi:putative lipoprotein
MNGLFPLVLGFRLTFGGTAPLPKPDRWLGEDKLQHFFLSFALTNMTYGVGRWTGMDPTAASVTAGATAAAAGIGKEIYDHQHGGRFSVKDLTWDGLGIATGLVVTAHARK